MTKSTCDILTTERDGRIFNFRPCLFAAFCTAIGIWLSYLIFRYSLSVWWCLSILPIGILPYVVLKSKSSLIASAGLMLAFLIGVCGMTIQLRSYTSAPVFTDTVTVVGQVTKLEFDGGVTLDKLSINGEQIDGKLFFKYDGEEIRLADLVRVRGKVSTNNALWELSGETASNVVANIRFGLSGIENVESIGRRFDLFLLIRERMTEAIYRGMDESAAAVTVALTMGDTSGIEKELLENVRFGGIGHIFAVSGLHVGALYAFCRWLSSLERFREKRGFWFVFIALILFGYCGICGFSSSVTRAFVMCMTVHMTKLIGIKTDTLENTGVAACILFLIRPATLFETGFQLSFAACLSIGVFSNSITRGLEGVIQSIVSRYAKEKKETSRWSNGFLPPSYWQQSLSKFLSLLAVTLGAQVLPMPILFHTFGYVSPWGLFLNLLIVPLISAAFSIILATVVVASVFPALSGGLLYLVELFVTAITLPFEYGIFEVSGLFAGSGVFAALAYYVIVLNLSEKSNVSRSLKKLIAILFFLIFLFSLIFS